MKKEIELPADVDASDSFRYSQKLWRYLPAIGAIAQVIQQTEKQNLSNGDDFEIILQGILPDIRKAFASTYAFCANTKKGGKIFLTDPKDCPLRGEYLPDQYIELAHDGTYVDNGEGGIDPELSKLGIKSLLVAKLRVFWGDYLVGVCNSDEDYLGEDKKLFGSLMKFLEVWVSYSQGYTQAQKAQAYTHYLEARRRGEYHFLSRASEDHTRFELGLENGLPDDAKRARIFFRIDDLLADYLDAELSEARGKSHIDKATPNGQNGVSKYDKILDELIGLIALPLRQKGINSSGLIVWLKDNQTPIRVLPIAAYPRTILAIARISLWVGYIKAGAKIPECRDDNCHRPMRKIQQDLYKTKEGNIFLKHPLPWPTAEASTILEPPDVSPANTTLGDLHHLTPGDLIDTLFSWLTDKVDSEATKKKPDSHNPYDQFNVDWLRTLWQKIHYLARSGMSEPSKEWCEEIDKLYEKVYPQTASVLRQDYLQDGTDDFDSGMRIDSDWLAVWLVSNVLLSKPLAEYYKLCANECAMICSPAEKMRYVTHLSHLVLYALHCVRCRLREKELRTGPEANKNIQCLPFRDIPADLSLSLSEAQLYVLSEYAYRHIGVHRELSFFERLTRQLCYELPLYAASEFYRDHLYHVIDVCLLGELLLRSRLPSPTNASPSANTFADICVEGLEPPDVQQSEDFGRLDTQQLMQNWYIAALCHDLGYVIERVGNLIEPVHKISGPGLDKFWEMVSGSLKSAQEEIRQTIGEKLKTPTSLQPAIKNSELDHVTPTDHGIAAWLHLHQWLEQVQKPPQIIAHALNAIVRHNLAGQQGQEVRFAEEPLSFLLILCDHLQEWGRPKIGPEPLAKGVLEALRFSKPLEVEQKVSARELSVKGLNLFVRGLGVAPDEFCQDCVRSGNCTGPCPRIRTEIYDGELNFELQHTEPREGNFEPAISWLTWCAEFQGLQFDDGKPPFKINITLIHHQSLIWQMLPWQPLEMDLMQEFASGYEPYLCQWIEKARRGQDGIVYKEGRGEEIFTISLNRLNHPLSRGLLGDSFKKFYKWKWQRLGQQFLNVSLGSWFPDL